MSALLVAAPCPGIQQLVPRSPGARLLTLCPDLFQGGQEIQLCLLLQGLGSVDLFLLWVAETKDIPKKERVSSRRQVPSSSPSLLALWQQDRWSRGCRP